MTQIKFNQLDAFLKDYGVNPRDTRRNLDLFRYICYENIELIRKVNLPKIELNQKNEAVIIESRNLPHIEFVIRNAILKLGQGWSHTIVCSPDNFKLISEICNNIGDGINILKSEQIWSGIDTYNQIMYDVNFWKLLKGERILIYHEDSIVFRNNIKDFLLYDYIGAPWGGRQPLGLRYGNGGFSLRNRSKIIDILSDPLLVAKLIDSLAAANSDDNSDIKVGKATKDLFPSSVLADANSHFTGIKMDKPAEDLFFSLAFKTISSNMPSVQVASYFSTEHFVNNESLGGHQFWHFDPNWIGRMLRLLDGLKPTDPKKVS